MKYHSTRGGMAPQSFSDILLEGLAPDGGLTIPVALPQVSSSQLRQWRSLSYPELAYAILQWFVDDIPAADLEQLVHQAYDSSQFTHPDIVPLKPLDGNLTLLGLSQGPTLAFKDMAMQFLGQVFEYVLARRQTTLNILGATSGDTGSAAEYALRGKKGVQVFMLSPQGRMSAFQRAQMYSLQDPNIHNLAIEGAFDDCQDIVKQLAADLEFKAKYRIGAVNSINWARIAAQIVYYFWGWLRASHDDDQPVSFAVPSGNFGNILAGHLARSMGLPVRRLVLATNENNVLEEFFRTGVYRPRPAAETLVTSSPSMDISRASNFERFVYDLMDGDAERVRQVWDELGTEGSFDFRARRSELTERYGFVAGTSSHADRIATIRQLYQSTGIIVDPHTADGVFVARQYVEPDVPMLVLETALPAKFTEVIQEALQRQAPVPAHLEGLHELPQRVVKLPAQASDVADYIREHALRAAR